jgi:hypothetical protein
MWRPHRDCPAGYRSDVHQADFAGVAKSMHGARKTGATRAADNSATVAELEAVPG